MLLAALRLAVKGIVFGSQSMSAATAAHSTARMAAISEESLPDVAMLEGSLEQVPSGNLAMDSFDGACDLEEPEEPEEDVLERSSYGPPGNLHLCYVHAP